jgi:hypothetical protein
MLVVITRATVRHHDFLRDVVRRHEGHALRQTRWALVQRDVVDAFPRVPALAFLDGRVVPGLSDSAQHLTSRVGVRSLTYPTVLAGIVPRHPDRHVTHIHSSPPILFCSKLRLPDETTLLPQAPPLSKWPSVFVFAPVWPLSNHTAVARNPLHAHTS